MAAEAAGGAAEPPRHRLPGWQLDSLARSEGDPEIVASLIAAERSCRLLLLRELLEVCARRPGAFGPLAGVEEAWASLEALEKRASPDLVAVLMHPQVGSWLAGALRILRGTVQPGVSLWTETGWLHAVIFAVAVRAGVPMTTLLPVRDGSVLLPTLGLALAGPGPRRTVAEAVFADGRATITFGDRRVMVPVDPARDGPGWWALRRIEAQANGARIAVWLDDIDPYRDLAVAVAPDRLDGAALARWSELFGEAWRILQDAWPEYARSVAAGLSSICPLAGPPNPVMIRSASTADAFGAALLERPGDGLTLAVTLVHELQHILLGGLLRLTGMHVLDDGRRFYAPWRDDPRPLGGLQQGTYAFLGMAELWKRVYTAATGPEARLLGFELAYARRQTGTAMRALRRSPALTDVGRRFVDGMAEHLCAVNAVRLPRDVERAAWLALAGHRTIWRLRNVVPEPEAVARLARDWRAGRMPGAGPIGLHLTGGPEASGPQRIAMIRQWITGSAPAPDLAADEALLAGEHATAIAGFRELIRAEPADQHAWSGLGLALADGGVPGWHALLRDPSLVRDVHAAVRAAGGDPDPVGIAAWLGGA